MYCPVCRKEINKIGRQQLIIYGQKQPSKDLWECPECEKRFIIDIEEDIQ